MAIRRVLSASREASLGALEAEVLNEKVESLGRAGRRAETALAKLRAATGEERPVLLDEAAEAVWSFLVQRELCGLRNASAVVEDFAIPKEVIARVGIVRVAVSQKQ